MKKHRTMKKRVTQTQLRVRTAVRAGVGNNFWDELWNALARILGASTSTRRGLVVYRVQPGDTLWGISEKYFGTPNEWQKICAANRLADCNMIRPGQILTIPG